MLRFLRKRMSVLMALAALGGLAAAASAVNWKAFDTGTFRSALKSGGTVLVDFHATWCPTCTRQKASLDKVLADKEFQGVSAFAADYDTSTDLKREMQVRSQSTLILFKGGREVARSIGTTDPDELRAFLRKGL
jgi:thiol-disulfide isomerase/thioredoxin